MVLSARLGAAHRLLFNINNLAVNIITYRCLQVVSVCCIIRLKYGKKDDYMSDSIKRCPFCEEPLVIVSDDKNNGEPYFECATCGLRFKIEGFEESPVEIRE